MNCTLKEENDIEVPWTTVTMGLTQLSSNEGTMGPNKLTIKTNVHHNHFTSGKYHEKAK